MFNKISIIGFGAFGYAIANHLSEQLMNKGFNDSKIHVYDSDSKILSYAKKKRKHPLFSHSPELKENIEISFSARDALLKSDLVVISLPVQFIRQFLLDSKHYFSKKTYILNTCKGIESSTGNLVSDIIVDIFGKNILSNYCFISGGMIASDFIDKKGIFSADVVSGNNALRRKIKTLFESNKLSLNLCSSVRFYESASALKNIISLGAGILEGRGYPYSTRSLFISSSFYELRHLSYLISNKKVNDLGVAFWGDYIMSTTGDTRNRFFGKMIGKGRDLESAIEHMKKKNLTAEGYWAIKGISQLIKNNKSSLPIFNLIYEILYESRSPDDIHKFMFL